MSWAAPKFGEPFTGYQTGHPHLGCNNMLRQRAHAVNKGREAQTMNPRAAERASVLLWHRDNTPDHRCGCLGVDLLRDPGMGSARQTARHRVSGRVPPDARRHRAVAGSGVGARGSVADRTPEKAQTAGQA